MQEPVVRPPSVREQLGEAAAELLDRCREEGIGCWVDSGCLLGLIRDGQVPSWDKDVDLGVLRDDLDALRTVVHDVAARHGLLVVEKQLAGRTYAVIVKVPKSGPAHLLPMAIHVFDREQDWAVSPQPHLLVAKGARLARHRLGIMPPHQGTTWLLRRLLGSTRRAPRDVLVVLIAQLRLRRAVSPLLRLAQRRHRWGTVVVRHPLELWYTAWVYDLLMWRIDWPHVGKLDTLEIDGMSLTVPSDAESYLAARYGASWREPVRDWFYVLDDGCLHGAGR